MVSYFYRYAEGNNIQTNQTNTSPPPKQSRLPLIIGVVAGVVVLCVAILCIVIVCRRRKSHAIPISNNEVALQNKQNPSPNHFNQAYQSHAIATSISEPYANGQIQEKKFSFFILGSYKHSSEA